jgi:Zn ribbon nucleic-acid-binding protein
MSTLINIEIPDWDEQNKRPASKMPNCPICGEDELAMFELGLKYIKRVVCYKCGFAIDFSHKQKGEVHGV